MEQIPAKSMLIKCKDTGWFGIEYNMNIYKGCCHGCIYCDSRSDCYRIEDFDRVRTKENALQILRDELRRKNRMAMIGTGAMSDPYNPFEKELKLTRNALELINAFSFGVSVATKSDLIIRDTDILEDIKEHAPVLVKVTITTADDELAKIIEPGAPLPTKRFEAIRALSKAGIFVGILLMPVLPMIEDHEDNIRQIIEKAHACGARFIYPSLGVTLRNNQREWYYAKLDKHFPGLSEKYMKKYGNRYQCGSPHAKKLWKMIAGTCSEKGMYYTMSDIIMAYKRGYESKQMTLFDMGLS